MKSKTFRSNYEHRRHNSLFMGFRPGNEKDLVKIPYLIHRYVGRLRFSQVFLFNHTKSMECP
jgi:hypothetical protein